MYYGRCWAEAPGKERCNAHYIECFLQRGCNAQNYKYINKVKMYYTKEVQYPKYKIYHTRRGEMSDIQQKGLYTKYKMYHAREVQYPKYKMYHTRRGEMSDI